MAYVITDDANYSAIASAIRSKLGVQTAYLPSEMAAAVASISGGGGSEVLSGAAIPTPQVGDDGDVYVRYADSGYIDSVEGYELHEYAETDANIAQSKSSQVVYVDLNASAETPTVRVEMDVERTGTTRDRYFLAFRTGSSSYSIGFGYNSDGDPYYLKSSSDATLNSVVSSAESTTPANERYTLTAELALSANNVGVELFGVYPATTSNIYALGGRIYRVKVSERTSGGDYTLIHDLAPCVRKADGYVGFYDFVNDSFSACHSPTSSGLTLGQAIEIDGSISNVYLKVDGSWRPIIGADISDVG